MEEWISLTTVQDVTPKVLTCIIHRYFIGFLRLLPTTESIPPCQIFEHSAFAFPGIQNAIATFIRVYGSLSSYKLITNLKREPFTRRCFRKGLLISVGRRASTLPTRFFRIPFSGLSSQVFCLSSQTGRTASCFAYLASVIPLHAKREEGSASHYVTEPFLVSL